MDFYAFKFIRFLPLGNNNIICSHAVWEKDFSQETSEKTEAQREKKMHCIGGQLLIAKKSILWLSDIFLTMFAVSVIL